MRKFYNTVLERRVMLDGDLISPPYEVGWSLEARFFLVREKPERDAAPLQARVQIAPNGHDWVDEGSEVELAEGKSVASVPVSHYGGWLRLIVTGATKAEPVELTLHLSLKE